MCSICDMMILGCSLKLRLLLLLTFLVEVINTIDDDLGIVFEDEEADTEGAREDDFFMTKCSLSQLEQHMWEYTRRGSFIYLPRLREVKRLYPGDKFRLSKENMCRDHGVMCPLLAEHGHCTGSDWNVGFIFLTLLFFMRPSEFPSKLPLNF